MDRRNTARSQGEFRETGACTSVSHPLHGGDLSNLAQSWVWRFSRSANLDRFVLLYLAYRYNEDKQKAWPSIKTIAEGCGISTSSVKRSLQALEELGELKITSRPSDEGDFASNSYELPATQTWIEEVVRSGRVYREGGRFPENLPGSRENRGVGSTGTPNSLESNSTKEREESPSSSVRKFEEELERKRQHKEQREARKRGERVFQKIPRNVSAPSRQFISKQPESWIWFSTIFKHLSDVNAVTFQELRPMVDEMLKEISREEAEERLSIFIDGAGKVSGYLARDFLEGGWKTIDPEEEHLPRIVNEE